MSAMPPLATQPVQRVSVHRPSVGAISPGEIAPDASAPPQGRRSYIRVSLGSGDVASAAAAAVASQASAAAAAAAPQPGTSPEGYKVEHIEVPYNPSETDHVKMKQLNAGGGVAYEFSSPFGFSQGDPNAAASASSPSTGAPWQPMMAGQQVQVVESTMHAQPQWRPPAPMSGQQWQQHPGQWQPNSQPPPMYGGYGGPPPQSQPQYAPPPLEGWLSKKGHGGVSTAWNMRYWMLNGTVLSYSREERGAEAGRIMLAATTEVRAFNHPHATADSKVLLKKHPYAFEVFQGKGQRTYYLDPGSVEKRNLWMDRICQAIGSLRMGAWPQGAAPGGYR